MVDISPAGTGAHSPANHRRARPQRVPPANPHFGGLV